MQVTRIQQQNYNNYSQARNNAKYMSRDIQFTAAAPKSKFFRPVKKFFVPFKKKTVAITISMAHGVVKLLDNKVAEKIFKKTKDWNMVSHLSALTGMVLSGFYMKKTLQNDKLDPQKKVTLAINQGTVATIATVLAYTFDKFTNNKVEKFITKFQAANHNERHLVKYVEGINAAKKIMIFGLMYRFISPVFATPIANHIGNKIQEKKAAQKANTTTVK